MTNTRDVVERIREKCIEEGECLIWKGATDGRSTPVISLDRKVVKVRRVLLERKLGRPIRKGHVAARACHEPMCVACIEESPNRAKVAARRGAFNIASKAANISIARRKISRISEEQVQAIREAEGTMTAIAERFGISRAYVGDLKNNRRRPNYSNPFAGLMA